MVLADGCGVGKRHPGVGHVGLHADRPDDEWVDVQLLDFRIIRGELADALQRISQLATDYPEVKELDINPFIVGPVGMQAYVADARMTLSNSSKVHE